MFDVITFRAVVSFECKKNTKNMKIHILKYKTHIEYQITYLYYTYFFPRSGIDFSRIVSKYDILKNKSQFKLFLYFNEPSLSPVNSLVSYL